MFIFEQHMNKFIKNNNITIGAFIALCLVKVLVECSTSLASKGVSLMRNAIHGTTTGPKTTNAGKGEGKSDANLRSVHTQQHASTTGTYAGRKDSTNNIANSGSGMDRVVPKKPLYKKHGYTVLAIIAITVFAFLAYKNTAVNQINIDADRVVYGKVESGVFEDIIPVRGRVVPATTVYLDAVEGGRVERILVEDGASMKAGDLIVELSNPTLQLNVLGNETRVAEQLNNMRSIELSLEQNRLQHKRNLADIEYQIKLLERQLTREKELLGTGAVAQSQHDDTHDTLNWYKTRRELTLESQASDARMQESQLAFLKTTAVRLESNLEISRQNLENMNVRAPVNGKLSGFDIEVGQSIGRGERLGQIDTPDDFKMTANLDEFYLNRIAIGQVATFDNYELHVKKIYPQVTNGQFEVDFTFVGGQPTAIRRGQSMQMSLQLGDKTEALLIRNGAFYQDTGGQWVFVVSPDGKSASKRNVRMGRRNANYIEVLDGLSSGETIITSSYGGFKDRDSLVLSM